MADTSPVTPKTPAMLVTEMERMAELHPNYLWSITMKEGADMIRKLCALANKLKEDKTKTS